MTALLPYLFKVVLCSATLMAYYYLALRNKLFHQWNRFYLLAVVFLSLLVPCFSFTIAHAPAEVGSPVFQLLQVVTVNGPFEKPVLEQPDTFWKMYGVWMAYASVSLLLFIGLLLSLYRIYRLVKQHAIQPFGRLRLIITTAKGTPFSFFKYLFWNPSIDMTSGSGQQIFRHELAHIEEKHSLDKLFMQLVLVIGWINPVFWLIRYELRMVHEFIADRKAVQDGDASTLAAMILQAAYPQHYSQLTNAFFHQSIKRRLHMLTKIQNPKRNYISRILFLPLMALLTLAFTVRTELAGDAGYAKAVQQTVLSFIPMNEKSSPANDSTVLDKGSSGSTVKLQPAIRYTGNRKVKVVIDAGHGGHDNGAIGEDAMEKEIALFLAKEIQALNSNKNIEIILTRSNDQYVKLQDRVAMAAKYQADLFVSLHTSAVLPVKAPPGTEDNPKRGFEVFIPKDTVSYFQESRLLGSAILQQLNTVAAMPTNMQLLQQQMNIWVLNQNACPSILVECGYITNENDRQFLLQKEGQQQVAKKILAGIESYLQATDLKSIPVEKNKVNASYFAAVIADSIPPVVVKSGAKFTKEQLLAIPFTKLLQPDTEYTMESAFFTIDLPGGDITKVRVIGTDMPRRVKQLIEGAKSGNLITIDERVALTKEGKKVKLPNLVYFVQ